MAEATDEARQEVVHARQALSAEVDDLGAATRAALDIPAKVRQNPLRAAGLAGGAVFLAAGGPKRVLKAVERRVAPSRQQRIKTVLPKEIEKLVDKLGDDSDKVRGQLERDFVTYLKKEHPEVAPGGRSSFWRTYDVFIGSLGALAARELGKKLFESPADRVRAASVEALDAELRADAERQTGARPGPDAQRRAVAEGRAEAERRTEEERRRLG
jgi:hypothetical protein